MTLENLTHPVIAAPMAGGPSTVELVVAVGEAGGMGFLAAGYRSADDVRGQIAAVRAATAAPFGVNVFVPADAPVDDAAVRAYAERVRREAARLGVEPGEPVGDDDGYRAKLALLKDAAVSVVSFTFGVPAAEDIAALRGAGSLVLVTVTSPEEGEAAARAGADALVAQGWEAGAHRGSHSDVDGTGEYSTLVLVRLLHAVTGLPVVASGGIVDGAGVAAALSCGAVAAQLGTAFLRCPEAGTGDVHRAALAAGTPGSAAPTAVTRAFTGRRARGIVNRFLTEHGPAAPSAYPHLHHLTAPVRAAGRRAGDAEVVNLWAGQGYPLAVEVPAGELVRRLSEEARRALDAARARLP